MWLKALRQDLEKYRIHGHAKFVGPTSLQVDDHTRINARRIVIATGSEPFAAPPFDGIKDEILFNEDVFELKQFPKHNCSNWHRNYRSRTWPIIASFRC